MSTTPQAASQVSILRYEDIEEELRHGRLITEHTQSSIQPSSYDLRVGTVFRDGQIINQNHQRMGEQFIIQPGEIVSLLTMEEVHLPDSMIAIAFPMNKWSSEGLLVLNPGYVDPGFKGPLSVKIVNLRKTRIGISRGQAIFTVSFFHIGASTTHPYNRNKVRGDREVEMNTKDLEQSAASIAELLKAAPDKPYTTKDEVDKIIREQPFVTRDGVEKAIRDHWMSWTVFFVAVIGSIAAVVAAIAALIPLFPKGH
jgi:deoxycytidine triphosphate deaminase